MQRIGFVVFPGFQLFGFAAASVFEFANDTTGKPLYDVCLLSEHGGSIKSSLGMAVETAPFDETVFDTLIFGGSTSIEASSAGLLSFVQTSVSRSRRVASICTGAFVLAEAGVLDGRRATTHWFYARDLQSRYPKVILDEDRIFIVDGSIWTSAGMTAGIDLALAMVEKDHGADLTRMLAKKLVVYHRRAGGQSQFSVLLALEPKSDRIQSALAYAKRNLHTPLSVEQLAAAANLSARQFSRSFRLETGQSPAKAIEHLRVEAARLMMEQGRLSAEAVADETGFADTERMRRAFLRAFGQPPQVIRRNARGSLVSVD
jgi:transcriptional regulator GlxA family with amidase domain